MFERKQDLIDYTNQILERKSMITSPFFFNVIKQYNAGNHNLKKKTDAYLFKIT